MGNNFLMSKFNLPPVVANLLLLNVLMFGTDVLLRIITGYDMAESLALHYVTVSGFKPIQFVSYMFLHGGFAHLFWNMLALWMIGPAIEHYLGSKRFFVFYIVCGIGAALLQMVVTAIRVDSLMANLPAEYVETVMNMVKNEGREVLLQGKNYSNEIIGQVNLIINTTTVGASGSIFGLLMAFGMFFPNLELYVFGLLPVKAKFLVIFYAAIELVMGMQNNIGDNVAHFAHLGGILFAFILIMWWRKRGEINTGF